MPRRRTVYDTPTGALDGYRAAGNLVVDRLDTHRAQLAAGPWAGVPFWLRGGSTGPLELSAWIVRISQTAGDLLYDNAASRAPEAKGMLPAVTVRQALAFYGAVEEWASRADEAASREDYHLSVHLPVTPWEWATDPDVPAIHLDALVALVEEIEPMAGGFLTDVLGSEELPDFRGARTRIEGEITRAAAAGQRASALWSTRAEGDQLRRDVFNAVRECLDTYCLAGQFTAMPSLIDRRYTLRRPQRPVTPPPASPSRARRTSLSPHPISAPPRTSPPPPARAPAPAPPAHAPADIWCLTAPGAKAARVPDRSSAGDLQRMWQRDDDWHRTVAIQAQIDAEVKRGHIRAAGQLHRVPWQPVYEVTSNVTIDDISLTAGQRFVLFVRGIGFGGFRRAIVTIGRTIPVAQLWALTAPVIREQFGPDPARRQSLIRFWAGDPDPRATLAAQQEIDTARRARTVRQTRRSARHCPWSSVYLAHGHVSILDSDLEPGDLFVLELGPAGPAFQRRVIRIGGATIREALGFS